MLEVDAPLGDRDAVTFFDKFYRALADGREIDVATADARRHVTRRGDSPPGPGGGPPSVLGGVAAELPAGPAADEVDAVVRRRLRHALEGPHAWRTPERLAIEAAVPEKTARDVLRADDEVRFSKSRNGSILMGLISRVGP